MDAIIGGNGHRGPVPSTYQGHFSLDALGGIKCTTNNDGTWKSTMSASVTERAGKGGLLAEACGTMYRTGGAPTKPPGTARERPRHPELSGTFAGDYAGRNTLWPGEKGPTYGFKPASQITFGSHRLSDIYTKRAPGNQTAPEMYRPWTSHSNSTHQDPQATSQYWRAKVNSRG